MKTTIGIWAVCLCVMSSQAASTETRMIKNAARKYFPEATWRESSIVVGDFSCSGKIGWAALGVTPSEILVAVFVRGFGVKPEILRYSRSIRNASTTVLSTEGLDYDPVNDLGFGLPGFQRSKTCKGLNLSDGDTDSAHIYWNQKTRGFEDWSR